MERRERTRRLIELGGLVQKAGIVELTGDDRPTLLGAFLALADVLVGPSRDHQLAAWRHRGKRAFDADQAARDAAHAGASHG
jgi:conjugative transfer protein TraD